MAGDWAQCPSPRLSSNSLKPLVALDVLSTRGPTRVLSSARQVKGHLKPRRENVSHRIGEPTARHHRIGMAGALHATSRLKTTFRSVQ
jgi:hypothetical protein